MILETCLWAGAADSCKDEQTHDNDSTAHTVFQHAFQMGCILHSSKTTKKEHCDREYFESAYDDSMNTQNDRILSENDKSIVLESGRLYKEYETITNITLMDWITAGKTGYIVIDVRNEDLDYPGGHIKGSLHFQHDRFRNEIAKIIARYHQMATVIIHCMYSCSRGPKCCKLYCDALNILLNISQHNAIENDVEARIQQHHLDEMQNDRQWRQALDAFDLSKVQFDNLCNQKVLLLSGGFFGFLNGLKEQNRDSFVIEFNPFLWEWKDPRGEGFKFYHKHDW